MSQAVSWHRFVEWHPIMAAGCEDSAPLKVTDEDGVDVVEAIDAWIDEEIDALTDSELESILEILDAVSASSLANVDADDVYDDDIDELVELTGGSAADRSYTNRVLRAALFGEPLDHDSQDGDPEDRDGEGRDPEDRDPEDRDRDADEPDDDGGEADDSLKFDDPTELHDDPHELDEDSNDALALDHEDELDEDTGLGDDDIDGHDDVADDEDQHRDFLADLADAQHLDSVVDENHANFLADVGGTSDQVDQLTATTAAVQPVELRAFDELGPSFLSETYPSQRRARPNRKRRSRASEILLPAFMIVGLAAFAFGMVQLIDSLNEDDAPTEIEVADRPEPTATPTPRPRASATEVPEPTAPVDPSAPTPTPTPEPTPPPRIGIRLVTGDIMIADFPEIGSQPELSALYDASDDDLTPALQMAWLDQGLGVVDSDGNVLVVDPDARRPEATIIYEAGGGFGEATQIASVDGLVAILTEDGDINLTPSNGRADPDVIQIVWDAEEEGAKATALAAVGGLVPFVLDSGDAQMIVTDQDNAIVPIWASEDQPPAFNVGRSPSGILLGVGQGAVARYNLDGPDTQRLESVWDPFTREDEPAIGYSSAGDTTAIVTGNGAIVLAGGDPDEPPLWDPELTEIRAFIALGNDSQIVALLETGSVVRIPLDPDQLIESIWDITDETLNPANQVVVEPPPDPAEDS